MGLAHSHTTRCRHTAEAAAAYNLIEMQASSSRKVWCGPCPVFKFSERSLPHVRTGL